MKNKLILFLFCIFSIASIAQRKAEKITIDIKPVDGKGFSGTLELLYAFENCFGDVNMLFTYQKVKIDTFSFEGQIFSTSDLEIDSFEPYLIVPDIYLMSIMEPDYFKDGRPRYGGIDGGVQKTIKSNIKLDNVLDVQLAGCYGQTLKVGSAKTINHKFLYLPTNDKNYAIFSWEAKLSSIAKCKINPNCKKDSIENKLKQEKNLEKNNLKYYKVTHTFYAGYKPTCTHKHPYGWGDCGSKKYKYVFYVKSKCQPSKYKEDMRQYMSENLKKIDIFQRGNKYYKYFYEFFNPNHRSYSYDDKYVMWNEITHQDYEKRLRHFNLKSESFKPYKDALNKDQIKKVSPNLNFFHTYLSNSYPFIYDFDYYPDCEDNTSPKDQINSSTKPINSNKKKKSYWDN